MAHASSFARPCLKILKEKEIEDVVSCESSRLNFQSREEKNHVSEKDFEGLGGKMKNRDFKHSGSDLS